MADADIATTETKTDATNGAGAPPAAEPEKISFSKPEFAARLGQAERSAIKKLIERAREAGVEIKDADDLVGALVATKQTRAKADETVESLRGELVEAKRIAEERAAEVRRAQIEVAFDRRARAMGAQHPELLDRAFEAWCEEQAADPLEMAEDQWRAFGDYARARYAVLFAPAAQATPVAVAPAPPVAVAPDAGGSARAAPAAAKAAADGSDLTPDELAAATRQATRFKWPLEQAIKTMREEKAKRAAALNPAVWTK